MGKIKKIEISGSSEPVKQEIKKRRKKSSIETQLEASMKSKRIIVQENKERKVDPNRLVPTGCTTYNLECSGRIEGAYSLGKIVNIIGDSHAGKTLFALTIFAECAILPRFDDFLFVYDDVEAANEFDIPYLFGKSVAERIGESVRSRTIEQFNDKLARLLEKGKPFIYVLDSFDALTSEAAMDKDEEDRKNREKGNEVKGSYGDGKPKKASEMFTLRTQDLSDNNSLLIVISQTRDNIGFGAQFTPKRRSGGKALKFYAANETWLACEKREKKGKRTMITNVQAKVTKNKLTGRHGEAYFPILFDYGIDDISACINFLMDEGDWTGTAKSIDSKGVFPTMSRSALVGHIEKNKLEQKLREQCQVTYDKVINALKPDRKRRY